MTSNEFRQSSTVFGHRFYPQALLLRHSPFEPTLASAYPPKPQFLRWVPGVTGNHFGQSSTVFRHRLHLRALPARRSPLRRSLASAYPPKPLLFTLLGVGACDMLEQIEKLSRYRGIEQGLENCRNIGHSSKVRLYEHMVCM